MNFAGKNSGAAESSNIIINTSGTRRQQQKQYEQEQGGDGGNSFDEDDEEERQKSGQLSYPPLSSHHQHQPPALYHHQVPYHHHAARGGGNWMQGGELSSPPSSRVIEQVTPAPEDDSNQDQEGMMMVVEREHMFDKVVTPSDVGKLNRLVIPKQHAERYFPLDSSSNDKGLLLNFEDRNGKPWRFRYSYWNSSQSYVMTKGWSRFVKDKKLDAGDIVSFQRGVGGSAKDRLFIDWRHRPDAAPGPPYHFSSSSNVPFPLHQFSFSRNNWNPLFLQSQPAAVPSRSQYSNMMLQPSSYHYGGSPNYHNMAAGSIVNVNQSGSGSVIYYRSGPEGGFPQQQHMVGMGGMDPPPLPALPALPLPSPPTPTASSMVFESVPVVHGKSAAGKRLRLFGVNMDCPVSDEENEHDHDHDYDPTIMVSSNALTDPISMGNYHQFPYHHHLHQHQPASSSSTIPYLQLRPYEDEESQFHHTTLVSSSSTDALSKTTKSSSSRMTLDLDI